MPLILVSAAFAPGDEIPKEYTCDGSDISPPLSWAGVPGGAASLVLVVSDPDAPGGTFGHWGVYDIPASSPGLAAGYTARAPAAALHQVTNGFGAAGYGGPCPPPGSGIHHYRFELIAINRPRLEPAPGAGPLDLARAAAPYAVERAQLTGTYHH